MDIELGNKKYKFLINYQKDSKYRLAFNTLAQKTFPISFEEWYQTHYWNEKYIPYTLFDRNKAIANISINIMDFNILGEKRRLLQIGTVMTDKDYRNQRLSRFLMEQIVEEWNQRCDFIYLYANESVLDMYPKYGFDKATEYEYFKYLDKKLIHENCEKLNMDEKCNRDLLYSYAKYPNPHSKLTMNENADLVMFYCAVLSFLKENVFYIKSCDAIAIAKFNQNQIILIDVFSKSGVTLDKIIYSLANSTTEQVILGFTPKECSSYETKEISGDDTLFIQHGKTKLFDENKMMFPILSHA